MPVSLVVFALESRPSLDACDTAVREGARARRIRGSNRILGTEERIRLEIGDETYN